MTPELTRPFALAAQRAEGEDSARMVPGQLRQKARKVAHEEHDNGSAEAEHEGDALTVPGQLRQKARKLAHE